MANKDGNEKYAYLNRLSTEQLEELLRADIESPESGNVDVIFHILEVIEKREEEHPTGRLPDEDKAWAEFQQYYNIPEGEGQSLYPIEDETVEPSEQELISSAYNYHRLGLRSSIWKRVGVVAATIAIFFALLVGVQAAGIDVFGALGRWTDETFHFVSPSNGAVKSSVELTSNLKNVDYYNSIQAALNNIGITEDLVPTWYPSNFEASSPQIITTRQSNIVNVAFHGDKEQFFSLVITQHKSASNLDLFTFEKDSTSVEQYTSGTKTFYIMSNLDTITATWSDGQLVEKISGSLTIDEVKAIIDSIGEL